VKIDEKAQGLVETPFPSDPEAASRMLFANIRLSPVNRG
jgi:hypothetical protein